MRTRSTQVSRSTSSPRSSRRSPTRSSRSVAVVASALITTRRTKSGPRYVVRYRLGGRAYGLVHGGSFRTLKEARARRDLLAGELANGRNPADVLKALSQPQVRQDFSS